ncbi:MAG: HD domain-containing phosphohydrolase [Thermoguttaceae bacterium]
MNKLAKEHILCVDDDPCILQAYQRALHKQFIIEGALGGEEALTLVATQGPYAVIVADMQMPGMNGIEFLVKAREIAPDSVRMILTGNADQQTAIDAVNQGHIFRFMTKPCAPEFFAMVLEAGLAQYRLITAERELLSQTLNGAIKVMTDVLALVSPEAFGRASRVHRLVRQLCRELGVQRAWLMEIAAMLSQIGCVAVPHITLSKVFKGQKLSIAEQQAYLQHPQTARELLKNIPRLEEVAEIIAHQNDRFQGVQKNVDPNGEMSVPGKNILKVALDWDALVAGGMNNDIAISEMINHSAWYHPLVLAALRKVMRISNVRVVRQVAWRELSDGMVLAEDVRALSGMLLCAKDQEVNPSMRAYLTNFATTVGIKEPIKIFIAMEEESDSAEAELQSN